MSGEGEGQQRVSNGDKRIQRIKRWLRDPERMSRKNHSQVQKGAGAGCPHGQPIPVSWPQSCVPVSLGDTVLGP